MRVKLSVVAATCLMATMSLSSCGGGESGSESQSAADEMLGYVPADATSAYVTFWEGVRADVPPEQRPAALMSSPIVFSSEINRYSHLLGGFGFSLEDVSWEANFLGAERYGTVVKLDDDVDMGKVSAGLERLGYVKSDESPGEHWAGMPDPMSSPPWFNVVVAAGSHLLIVNPGEGTALEVLQGESWSDTDAFTGVEETLGDVNAAYITTGDSSCIDPASLLESRATPEQIAQIESGLPADPAQLHPFETSVLTSAGGPDELTLAADMFFSAEQDAAADEELRTRLVEAGSSLATREPFSDIVSVAGSEVEGARLHLDLEVVDAPKTAALVAARDLPWLLCGGG